MKIIIKRALSLILCAAFLFTLAACGANGVPYLRHQKDNKDDSEEGDLLARIKSRGTLIIATEGDWAPWTYHDESDKLVGFDVEVGALIAKKLGVTPDFKETQWDSILEGVASGRFDLACNGVGYTEKRAESLAFSTPYVYTHKVLVVKKDNDTINSFEDLKDKTTANTASSTYAAIAEEYGAKVTPVDALIDTLELVIQGRVDATINSQETILDYLKEHPDANIKIVAESAGDPVCYPTAKTDDAKSFIEEVNRILEELRQSGELAALSLKYFDVDITKESSGT